MDSQEATTDRRALSGYQLQAATPGAHYFCGPTWWTTIKTPLAEATGSNNHSENISNLSKEKQVCVRFIRKLSYEKRIHSSIGYLMPEEFEIGIILNRMTTKIA